MASKLLTERFGFSAGKVDRTGPRPIVRGVLLCGATSQNRRRYRKEAFAGDRIRKYADRPVFLDHGTGHTGRRYEDQIGWIRNPRLRADGMPEGDIEVKPKHPLAGQFLDDAEHDPNAVGLSHVANCETAAGRDGWDDVTSIEDVHSVDVVLDPATTKGLYESTKRRTAMPTIKRYLSEVERHRPRRARLAARLMREATSAGFIDAAPMDASAPDADHNQAVGSAFESAGHAVWTAFTTGELSLDDALAKLRKLAKAHDSVKDSPEDDGADDAEPAAAASGPDEESRRRGRAIFGESAPRGEAAVKDWLSRVSY